MGDATPEHLYGTFRAYKSDTDFCAQWLVENATRTGYNAISYLSDDRATSGPVGRQILQTQHFQLLASHLAEQWPKIPVSDEFLRRLKSAVEARRLCAAWHKGFQTPQIQERNDTHEHFIGVLEQVYKLFKPLHQQQATLRRPKQRYEATITGDEAAASPNTFGVLLAPTVKLNIRQNRGGSGLNGDLPDHEKPKRQQEPTRRVQVSLKEPVASESEANFLAVNCLLTDLHKLRALNREICTMTNTIVDFATRLIEEFWRQIDKPESYAHTLVDFFATCTKVLERGPAAQGTHAEHLPVDPADFIFFPAWLHVQVLFIRLDGRKEPVRTSAKELAKTPPQEGGKLRPIASGTTVAPSAASHTGPFSWLPKVESRQTREVAASEVLAAFQEADRLKIDEDHMALLSTAFGTALHLPSKAFDQCPTIEDQVLRLFRWSLLAGRVELTTSFAAQLFIDVHELQESGSEVQGLRTLDASLRSLVLKSDLHRAYFNKIGRWWVSTQDHLTVNHPRVWYTTVKEFSEHVLNNTSCRENFREVQDDIRGHLTCSPIARGIDGFCLTAASANGCSFKADGLGMVLSFIHFYNACRQSGATTIQWRDLDYLIDAYGTDYLFMGGLPRTLQACVLKYRLVLGESLQYKAKDVAMCRAALVKNKRPFGSRMTPLVMSLLARIYGGGRTYPQEMLQDAELILAELHRKGTSHRIKMTTCGQLEDTSDLQLLNKNAPSMSHTEFLVAMKDRLALEVRHLEFDFFALIRRCIGMLTSTIDELEASGVDPHLPGLSKYKEGRSTRTDAKLEPMIIADTLIQYAMKMEMQGLLGTKEMPWSVDPPGYEQAEVRFQAVVRGMEKTLLKMKKDGVKDLCDAVGWTGPSEMNGNDHAAADHLEGTNGTTETGGSET